MMHATKEHAAQQRLQEGGYIAVMTVLILCAVATAIGVTLLWTGTDAQRLTLGEQQSRQAHALAVACGQEALQQIHDNLAFTATNASMSLGQGTCKYSVGVAGGAGSTRLVSAAGTVGNVTRKVQTSVTVNASTITAGTWKDMPDRYATISYVQGADMTNDTTVATAAVAFPANVTSGNFIIAAFTWDNTSIGLAFSCSDSRGNTYSNVTTAWNDATNTQSVGICYAPITSGGAADTVTVTFGGGASFRRLIVGEYSGVATTSPVDGFTGIGGGSTATGTDGTTSGNITTTQDGDLIFSVIETTAVTRGPVPGTGFTARLYTNSKDLSVEDKQQPLAGTTAGTWTMPAAGDRMDIGVVAFKAALQ